MKKAILSFLVFFTLSFFSFSYENYLGFEIAIPVVLQQQSWKNNSAANLNDTTENGEIFAAGIQYMKIWNNNFSFCAGLDAGGSNIQVSEPLVEYTLSGLGTILFAGCGYRILDFQFFQLVLNGILAVDFYSQNGEFTRARSTTEINYMEIGILAGADVKAQFRIAPTVLITLGFMPLYKIAGFTRVSSNTSGSSGNIISSGTIKQGSFTLIPKIGAFIQLD